MADTAAVTDHPSAEVHYWKTLGTKLLAPLLFAAAVSDQTMADVVRWVDTRDDDEVTKLLADTQVEGAQVAWEASQQRTEKARDSVYGTAEELLAIYADERVQAFTEGHDLDTDALLDGDHTVYLYAPAHEQRRLRPLFETVTMQVVRAAQERAARALDGLLDPRLLLALDEAGNVAALAELPELATTARGQGIQLLSVWHDLAQLSHRYGDRAATVLNNHRAKVFLSGLADLGALELASKLIGEQALTEHHPSSDSEGRHSLSQSTVYRPLLPVEELRRLTPGQGSSCTATCGPPRSPSARSSTRASSTAASRPTGAPRSPGSGRSARRSQPRIGLAAGRCAGRSGPAAPRRCGRGGRGAAVPDDPATATLQADATRPSAVAQIRRAYQEREATSSRRLVAAELACELGVSETMVKLTLRALRGRQEPAVDPTTVQDRIQRLYQTRERQAGKHLRVPEVAAEVGTNPRYVAATLYVLRALDRDGPTPRAQWAAARARMAAPADLDELANLHRAVERGRDGGWRADAACASPGVDPELFFPDRGEQWKAAEAKQLCAGCPVTAACLHEALTGPQAHGEDVTGIFGGTSQQQRRRLRGRPRVNIPTRFSTDQGQAAEALELARRVGMTRAAEQLGVSTEALYHAWDRWQLGRPHGHRGSPPSQVRSDRDTAVGAFQRAQLIGITAAAAETGVSHRTLRKAWVHHGLGLPDRPARTPATRPLDLGFLRLPGNEAFARSTRAGPGQLAARARRLEELETLTPRVVYDATAENRWPRRETRVWVIASRAQRAADLATQHTHAEQGDPHERVRQRLAASHQRRQAARAQHPTHRGSRLQRTPTTLEQVRER